MDATKLLQFLKERIKTGPYTGLTGIEKFFLKIKKGLKCWKWKGKRYPNDYGCFTLRGQEFLAHRISCLIQHGDINGVVCHTCDHPWCVNPEHLFLGTHSDNAEDMILKGRNNPRRGEECHRSKLTEEDIRDIRTRASQGEMQKNIAKDYPVSQKQITMIVNNKQWRHVI